MELQFPYLLIPVLTLLSFFFLHAYRKKGTTRGLPPGPWKLPFIGNMWCLVGSAPHRALRDLAKKYRPLMHLQLGEISAVVVSTPQMAKEFMKTHDVAFADRQQVLATKIIFYDCEDIATSRYGNYWRQMRKICTLELLTVKKVRSFRAIREEEVCHLIESIQSSAGSPINLTEKILALLNVVSCRVTVGKTCKHQDLLIQQIKLTALLAGVFDLADLFPSFKYLHFLTGLRPKLLKIHHKDMLAAGTETSSRTIEWAMVEMIRNPRALEKAQAEIRQVLKGKKIVHEADIQALSYLKLVIKETLRLHPPFPLLLPRECREECEIEGFKIPVNTKVFVNAWAIGRDPDYWNNAESFIPERFENTSLDFTGNSLEYIPFGAGRRICAGISLGIANVELPLVQLLYHFNWKLPSGIKPEHLDMTETLGATAGRKENLVIIATSNS
ncbi:hypothetical protein RJ640_028474 [Escallonia rubra]|uniref:Cytochrome P450 n=1 Tax=Escallonia rubra TaxID=112253 RepID=A0AA88QVK2_9ASTE|nr:hypothetical protein RJ640_028474 [Escallonia rubra]